MTQCPSFADIRVLKILMERPSIDTKFVKLEANSSESVLRETLLACRSRGMINYLLLTRSAVTRKVIRQARRLGMISPTYAWLIFNPVSEYIFVNFQAVGQHCAIPTTNSQSQLL